MLKIFNVILLLAMLSSCVNDALEKRIAELETQLEECQNGPDKISGMIQNAFSEKDYLTVKSLFLELKEKYSGSSVYSESKKIFDQVIALEEKAKEEELKIAEAVKAEKLKALNKLKKNNDDVSGITWYYNPYFTHYSNTNLTSIYMGQRSNEVWLRLQMSYQGDNWIFFEKAYLSYDGNTKEINFNQYEAKETENSGVGVWEWIDVNVDDLMIPFLKALANSSDAKMRLSGKYSKTRNLSINEKKGILDVLNGYEALKSIK